MQGRNHATMPSLSKSVSLLVNMDINLSKKSHEDGDKMHVSTSSSAIEIPRVEVDESFRKRSNSIESGSSPSIPKKLELQTPIRKSSVSSSPLSPLSLHNLSIDEESREHQKEKMKKIEEKIIKTKSNSSAHVLTDVQNEVQCIVAGTTDSLIEALADKKLPEQYHEYFILTYRYHTNSEAVLTKLFNMYQSTEENERRNDIIHAIKKWIETSFSDFKNDKKLLGMLISFIGRTLPDSGNLDAARYMHTLLEQLAKKPETKLSIPDTPIPKPVIPRLREGDRVTFLDISAKETARQLTLIDFKMFATIPITEFEHQAWNTSEPTKTAPFLFKKINYFNELSYWASSEVVSQPQLKQRAAAIKRLIRVAEKCIELNNFNCAMAIVAGLNLSPIDRLKKTWKAVPSKSIETFNSLTDLMSTDGNYKNYRTTLAKASHPVNPYIGVFLRDLTFIEVGNPSKLENDLVNFDKLKMIALVLKEIIRHQQMQYRFEEVPIVMQYLKQAPKLTEELLHQYSTLCEPSFSSLRK